MRFTKTHRSVTTFDAIANGLTSEPPKYAVTENDETDGALGATDSDSDNGSDIFLQDVEPNAFHSMDEDDTFEALGKLALADAAAAADTALTKPLSPSRTVIVGGGPAGLAVAIALARRGWEKIEVWERLTAPPSPDDADVWGDPALSLIHI